MGQTLSEPVVEKRSAFGEDDRLLYGVSEMQGWRLSMEDAHTTVLCLDTLPPDATSDSSSSYLVSSDPTKQAKLPADGKSEHSSKGKRSFFAVYDGHGGATVARFTGETLHHRLKENDDFKKGDYEASLKRAFLGTDEDLRANPDFAHDPSGCTAVAALITEDGRIIVANAGDSRSVLSVGGKAKPMSFDHKPVNSGETSRIVAAGGFVEFGRVNGNLALSRAIGDFEFKKNAMLGAEQQIVTANPEIRVHQSTEDDEFLILACDGIWDVVTSQQSVDYVRRAIASGKELHAICEELMDRCLAPDSDWGGVGCDNMTLLIVGLLGDRTKKEWYEWIKDRVDKGVGYKTPATFPDPFANGPRGPGIGGLGRGGPLSGLTGIGGGNDGLSYGGGEEGHDDFGEIVYQTREADEDDDLQPVNFGSQELQEALRQQGISIVSARRSGGGDSDDDDEEDQVMEDAEESTPVAESPVLHQSPKEVSISPDHASASASNEDDPVNDPKTATKLNSAAAATNAEVPHGSVKVDGLMDKSEDPIKAAAGK